MMYLSGLGIVLLCWNFCFSFVRIFTLRRHHIDNRHHVDNVRLSNLADIDHLLPEKLSCAHTVLAPIGAQHLVHHLVRLHHAHGAQHLGQGYYSNLLQKKRPHGNIFEKLEQIWITFLPSPVISSKGSPNLKLKQIFTFFIFWSQTYLMMLVVTRLSVFMVNWSSPPDSIVTRGLLWFPSFLVVC